MNKENLREILNHWVLDSSVVCLDPMNIAYGAYSAGYNDNKKSWEFYYTEITGYAISYLSFMYLHSRDIKYKDQAKKAAEYLLRIQEKNEKEITFGAYPKGIELENSLVIDEYYSFDTAMCVQGLIDLYKVEKSQELLNSAIRAGNWLIKMQKEDGSFFAYYDKKNNEINHVGYQFYNDEGALHAKIAISLFKLFENTNDEKYKLAATKLVRWVSSLQNSNGGFWVNKTKAYIYAHVHCYVLEGLIYANKYLKDEEVERAIHCGVLWLKSVTSKRGILSTHMQDRRYVLSEQVTSNKFLGAVRKRFPRREIATDATSQMIRIMVLRGGLEHESKANYMGLIASHINLDSSLNPLSARIELSLGYPRKSNLCSTWGVLFALQALEFLSQDTYQNNQANLVEYLF